MKKLKVLFLASLLIPGSAFAANFNVPQSQPLASVILPDSWTMNSYANGIEGASSDGGIYFAFEVAEDHNVEDAVQTSLELFIKDGIDVDLKTQKKQKITINGLAADMITWAGKNKQSGKSVEVNLTLAPVDPSHFLIISNWGTPEAEKANAADLQIIAKSIKKLN